MAITQHSDLYAIILAGGASSRLHATSPQPVVDKPLLLLDGKSVIAHVIDAAMEYVPQEQIVVVGPATLPTGNIATIYEDPPRSGPYMAARAGVQHFTQQFGSGRPGESMLLLGADMPCIGLGIEQLVRHHRTPEQDLALVTRAGGRLQPLLSYMPRSAGEEAFAEPVMNAGVLRTLRTLDHHVIEVTETAVADIDTYQDAIDAGVTFSA